MHFLDLPRVSPPNEISELARSIRESNSVTVGSISAAEAAFLMAALQSCDAKRVVEIGVASGSSSRCILALLQRLGPGRTLFAFDALDYYYGDATKRVGYLASRSEFDHDNQLSLHPKTMVADVANASGFAVADPTTYIDAAFIDGSHRHPWATMDFLVLLGMVKEGGVIVFHDINLPFLTKLSEDFGPMIVFGKLVGERFVIEGPAPNIGYVVVRDRGKMASQAIAGLSEKWETQPTKDESERIIDVLRKALTPVQTAIVQAALDNPKL